MSKENYQYMLTYLYNEYKTTGNQYYKVEFEAITGLPIEDKLSIKKFMKTFHLHHHPNILIKQDTEKKRFIYAD